MCNVSVATQGLLLFTQFVAAMIGTWCVGRWASRGYLLDVPNDRSSHAVPTPRGGGVALVLAFSAGVLFTFLVGLLAHDLIGSVATGLLVAGVGLCDDINPIRARTRLLVQGAAAICAIGLLFWGAPAGLRSATALWLMFIGWTAALIWATNLFNFMDGIDGLAAAEAMFLGCSAALIFHQFNLPLGLQLLPLMIAASSAGFLVQNWSPASIFMGDVGSAFLGFSLALQGMYASFRYIIPLEVWVILSGVFFIDATVTLLVRAFRRQNPAKAHRTHAYQHLALKYGHRATVLGASSINVFWLLPWAIAAAHFPRFSTICMLVAYAPLLMAAFWLRAGRDAAIER